MKSVYAPRGRRERAKEEKLKRILSAASYLLAKEGINSVTTQQVADKADIAIGTLYLYAGTKAELLIMVQNQKFATAIEEGLAADTLIKGPEPHPVRDLMALIDPVLTCIREHPENGRTYMHELVFGDPAEPHRAEGLAHAQRWEQGMRKVLSEYAGLDAAILARVITSIVHVTATATMYLDGSLPVIRANVEQQIAAILPRETNLYLKENFHEHQH